MNKKEELKLKAENNFCRFCGRILKGLSPCSCINNPENMKLWQNPRQKSRIKLRERNSKPLPKE